MAAHRMVWHKGLQRCAQLTRKLGLDLATRASLFRLQRFPPAGSGDIWQDLARLSIPVGDARGADWGAMSQRPSAGRTTGIVILGTTRRGGSNAAQSPSLPALARTFPSARSRSSNRHGAGGSPRLPPRTRTSPSPSRGG